MLLFVFHCICLEVPLKVMRMFRCCMQCFYGYLVPAVTECPWSFKHEEMHQISGRALKRNQSHKEMRHCSQVSWLLLLSFLAGFFSRSHTFHPALNSSRGLIFPRYQYNLLNNCPKEVHDRADQRRRHSFVFCRCNCCLLSHYTAVPSRLGQPLKMHCGCL